MYYIDQFYIETALRNFYAFFRRLIFFYLAQSHLLRDLITRRHRKAMMRIFVRGSELSGAGITALCKSKPAMIESRRKYFCLKKLCKKRYKYFKRSYIYLQEIISRSGAIVLQFVQTEILECNI